jgi:hypothetical protein
MSADDLKEVIATLARIRRAIAALESECGRSAQLREQFATILTDVKTATSELQTPARKKPDRRPTRRKSK